MGTLGGRAASDDAVVCFHRTPDTSTRVHRAEELDPTHCIYFGLKGA